MLIAVPVDADLGPNSPVAGHFGRAPYYAMVDPGNGRCSVVPNGSAHHGGTLLPPEWLAGLGVEVLLCGGLGGRAIELCEARGIAVYLGEEPTVGAFVEAFQSGQLLRATGEDGCRHHESGASHG